MAEEVGVEPTPAFTGHCFSRASDYRHRPLPSLLPKIDSSFLSFSHLTHPLSLAPSQAGCKWVSTVNFTFAPATTYLHGCSWGFSISIFPKTQPKKMDPRVRLELTTDRLTACFPCLEGLLGIFSFMQIFMVFYGPTTSTTFPAIIFYFNKVRTGSSGPINS